MYTQENGFYIAHGPNGPISILGNMANRHGLIAGATGTGKTVTLQVIAESFCKAGVPCFMADMKGDLSGVSQPGQMSRFIEKRLPEFGMKQEDLTFEGCPVRFYDVFGEQGIPMRSTIGEMGPDLMGRILGLNDTQTTFAAPWTGYPSTLRNTPPSRATWHRPASAPSNAPCCTSTTRVPTNSSASRHLTSRT